MSKSKGKAKTASKNNPTSRSQAREFFYEGKKIKPVKLITASTTFFAAEFEDTGDIVKSVNGLPLPWDMAKIGKK